MIHRHREQRNWGARIREYLYRGLHLVTLENDLLRVGVLAGKGADIVELGYKPHDLDFAWLAPGGVRNPLDHVATAPDPRAAFRENYPGGWQEMFPNAGPPSSYDGAAMGQHGEVFNVPWDVEIVADNEDVVAVRFTVCARTSPCRLEKTIWLREGEPGLRIEQRLINLSPVTVRAMWGHHITFGRPFLVPGSEIRTPEGITVIPHPDAVAPGGRRVAGTDAFPWPVDPGGLDLRIAPHHGAPSDLVYLTGFPGGRAWYEVVRPDDGISARVTWDATVMPHLWFWQEFGGTTGYPWYGRLNVIGLEPCSSMPGLGLAEAVANGTALTLMPRQELHFWLEFTVLTP